MAVFLYGEASSTSSTRSWISSTVGGRSNMNWAVVSTRIVKRRASISSNSPAARPAFKMALVILAASNGSSRPSRLRMVLKSWSGPVSDRGVCSGIIPLSFPRRFHNYGWVGRSSGLQASDSYWPTLPGHKRIDQCLWWRSFLNTAAGQLRNRTGFPIASQQQELLQTDGHYHIMYTVILSIQNVVFFGKKDKEDIGVKIRAF